MFFRRRDAERHDASAISALQDAAQLCQPPAQRQVKLRRLRFQSEILQIEIGLYLPAVCSAGQS